MIVKCYCLSYYRRWPPFNCVTVAILNAHTRRRVPVHFWNRARPCALKPCSVYGRESFFLFFKIHCRVVTKFYRGFASSLLLAYIFVFFLLFFFLLSFVCILSISLFFVFLRLSCQSLLRHSTRLFTCVRLGLFDFMLLFLLSLEHSFSCVWMFAGLISTVCFFSFLSVINH